MARDFTRDMQVLPVGTRREVTLTVVGAAVFVAHPISAGALSRLPSALVAPSESDVASSPRASSL
jgi:hypothetical protein